MFCATSLSVVVMVIVGVSWNLLHCPVMVSATGAGPPTVTLVETVAGAPVGFQTSGFVDANGTNARFHFPSGIEVDPESGAVYVADYLNCAIRKVDTSFYVTTVAGSPPGLGTQSGATDNSVGTNARFNNPFGLCIHSGMLYISDYTNNMIRGMFLTNSTVVTIAGQTSSGYVDAVGTSAKFNGPIGLAYHSGSLLVTDRTSYLLRSIDLSTMTVTTIAGYNSNPPASSNNGYVDGVGTNAQFNYVYSVTVNPNTGIVYVADNNQALRAVQISSRTVSTLAGSPAPSSVSGYDDGVGSVARFDTVISIAYDNYTNGLVLLDTWNSAIRWCSLTGNVTTVAGSMPPSPEDDHVDGDATTARFYQPYAIVLHQTRAATYVVADNTNNAIRFVTFNYSRTSQGKATKSRSPTHSSSTSFSQTRSCTTTVSRTATVSPSWSVTLASRSLSNSASVASTDSLSESPGPTVSSTESLSASPTQSASLSRSPPRASGSAETLSITSSVTPSASTATRTQSATITRAAVSSTVLLQDSVTQSRGTATPSEQFSRSKSLSASPTPSTSQTPAKLSRSTTISTELISLTGRRRFSTSRSRGSATPSDRLTRTESSTTPPIPSTSIAVALSSTLPLSPSSSSSLSAFSTRKALLPSGTHSISAESTAASGTASFPPKWSARSLSLHFSTSATGPLPDNSQTRELTAVAAVRPHSRSLVSGHITPVLSNSASRKSITSSATCVAPAILWHHFRQVTPSDSNSSSDAVVSELPLQPASASALRTTGTAASVSWWSSRVSSTVLSSRPSFILNLSTATVHELEWETISVAGSSDDILLVGQLETDRDKNNHDATAFGQRNATESPFRFLRLSLPPGSNWLSSPVKADTFIRIVLVFRTKTCDNRVATTAILTVGVDASSLIAGLPIAIAVAGSTGALVSMSAATTAARISAVRSLALCLSSGESSGGVLGLSFSRPGDDEEDDVLPATRGAVVGNIVLIGSVGAMLFLLACTYSIRCGTTLHEGLLRLALPSTLLPVLMTTLPSAIGAAVYLFSAISSDSNPNRGLDTFLAVLGALESVMPLAIIGWIAIVLPWRLGLVARRATNEKEPTRSEPHAASSPSRPTLPRWRNILVTLQSAWERFSDDQWVWELPQPRKTLSSDDSKATTDVEPPENVLASDRAGRVVTSGNRVLWYCLVDATIVALIAAVGIGATFGGEEMCNSALQYVVVLLALETTLTLALKPLTSMRSHVIALVTLTLTTVSSGLQYASLFTESETAEMCSAAIDLATLVLATACSVLLDVPEMLFAGRDLFLEMKGGKVPGSDQEPALEMKESAPILVIAKPLDGSVSGAELDSISFGDPLNSEADSLEDDDPDL